MRTANAALTAFLLSRQPCWSADLFVIELATGGSLLLTSFDRPIIVPFDGTDLVYSNQGMTIERNQWEVKNTTDVPQLEIQMYSNGTDFNASNFKQLAHNGALDGASITLYRTFMPTLTGYNVSLGNVLLFGGRTSTVTVSATGVKIIVKGDNVLMQQYFPKNIYQLGCIHTLYDAGCKAVRSSFTTTNTVGSSGLNSIFIPWGGTVPSNASNYTLGALTITSGAGEGQIRTIENSTSSGLTLAYPLYTIPAAGDSFSISFGCDKQMSTCSGRFSNLQNFRGFPFIPPAETAYS
jgi:uncharacterized phage protein (TIGR02218 family)